MKPPTRVPVAVGPIVFHRSLQSAVTSYYCFQIHHLHATYHISGFSSALLKLIPYYKVTDEVRACCPTTTMISTHFVTFVLETVTQFVPLSVVTSLPDDF